ncbi:MAG: right-handed parallel beta-helix repeat-containing protein [Candidatus Hermodarchaeota archaeon]
MLLEAYNDSKIYVVNTPKDKIVCDSSSFLWQETSIDYNFSNAIFIDGDADFKAKAALQGWLGDGTLAKPYIIRQLNITLSAADTVNSTNDICIYIKNTRVNFHLESNLLACGDSGIVLLNVSNCLIINNIVYSHYWDGVRVDWSSYNVIMNNTLFNNRNVGINILNSDYINITSNSIYNNGDDGIFFFLTQNSIVMDNSIYTNGRHGIEFGIAAHNIATNNTLYNNSLYGVKNAGHDVFVGWNNFFENNQVDHAPQAYNGAPRTVFMYNYWSDWVTPDLNDDDLGDEPYNFTANSYDAFPRVRPYNYDHIHILTKPIILFPNGGEVLNKIVEIRWRESIDTLGYPITYTVYYSSNGGLAWLILASTASTYHNWNSTTVNDDTKFLFMVIADNGLMNALDISDSTFTIQNNPTVPAEVGVILGVTFITLIISFTLVFVLFIAIKLFSINSVTSIPEFTSETTTVSSSYLSYSEPFSLKKELENISYDFRELQQLGSDNFETIFYSGVIERLKWKINESSRLEIHFDLNLKIPEAAGLVISRVQEMKGMAFATPFEGIKCAGRPRFVSKLQQDIQIGDKIARVKGKHFQLIVLQTNPVRGRIECDALAFNIEIIVSLIRDLGYFLSYSLN